MKEELENMIHFGPNVMNICRNVVLCQIDGIEKYVLWLKQYLLEI